jgi:hypothetical protein
MTDEYSDQFHAFLACLQVLYLGFFKNRILCDDLVKLSIVNVFRHHVVHLLDRKTIKPHINSLLGRGAATLPDGYPQCNEPVGWSLQGKVPRFRGH